MNLIHIVNVNQSLNRNTFTCISTHTGTGMNKGMIHCGVCLEKFETQETKIRRCEVASLKAPVWLACEIGFRFGISSFQKNCVCGRKYRF